MVIVNVVENKIDIIFVLNIGLRHFTQDHLVVNNDGIHVDMVQIYDGTFGEIITYLTIGQQLDIVVELEIIDALMLCFEPVLGLQGFWKICKC